MTSSADEAPGLGKVAAAETVAALLGAGIAGASAPELLGSLVGGVAAAQLVPLVEKVAAEIGLRRLEKAALALHRGSEYAGVRANELVATAMSNGRRAQLLELVLQAAAAAELNKIDALARALANGLMGDLAVVDTEILMTRALADLDPIHVEALAILHSYPASPFMPAASLRRDLLGPSVLAEADVIRPVIAVLQRHGLVEVEDRTGDHLDAIVTNGSAGAPAFRCTRFGQQCLVRLEAPEPPETS